MRKLLNSGNAWRNSKHGWNSARPEIKRNEVFMQFISRFWMIAFILALDAQKGTVWADCATMPAGAVAWWRAENNALDSLGSHHGTLQNGATFATGEVGQAFSF